ncbi:hypothetical protein PG913_00440 [Tenacibaculum pacificus]|uniref:hypothetical protein n=1 Tax=Tenacibaculum pacificus TaxID=3018314 RepID=UPI0022F3C48B|nr:hypothetical protein [Tenacibaculum pacificus]WBX73762.1 hypothetical protein PG913_00440 [Tenacibaculum pacificus]
MQEPIQFYKEEINSLNTILIGLKKQLLTTRILRLLAFLTIALSAYVGFTKDNLFFILTGLGVITFGVLITKHLQLKQKKVLLMPN